MTRESDGDDVAAVSVIAGVFSNRAPAHGTETVIEANYRIQLTPWLYLTPDFQYVIHPNGSTSIPDAALLAGELSINFSGEVRPGTRGRGPSDSGPAPATAETEPPSRIRSSVVWRGALGGLNRGVPYHHAAGFDVDGIAQAGRLHSGTHCSGHATLRQLRRTLRRSGGSARTRRFRSAPAI